MSKTRVPGGLMPGLLVVLAMASALASDKASCWLEESDVIVSPGQSRTFVFQAPKPGNNLKPVLWLAPRTVFPVEERLAPTLVIELNDVKLDAARLISPSRTARFPCDHNCPVRESGKCVLCDGIPCWQVRWDNNFTVGETDFFSWRRQYALEGFEPSYAFDLAGLVRPGANRLVLRNMLDASKTPRAEDLEWPADSPLPWFSLHARFVRVGPISSGDKDAYDAEHTRSLDPCLRTFDVRQPAEFARMIACYTNAVTLTDDPLCRAFLRFAHGNYELWNGNFAEAEALFSASFKEAPAGDWAAQTLFLLGVAQRRQGRKAAAQETYATLKKRDRTGPWSDLMRRELVLEEWRADAVPVNWPVLTATRTEDPMTIDGRLEEEAWKRAVVTADFSLYPDKYRWPSVRTEARAVYDEKNLYVSVVCEEPFMAEVCNKHLERDSAVWYDDNVELFLDPGRSYARMFEFEIGVEGGIVDCLNVWDIAFMKYDPAWEGRIGKQGDRWVAELAIPWEVLNARPPRPGEVWLCNLVRTRPKSGHRPQEAAVLGHSTSGYAAHEEAAWLIFR